MFAQQQRKRNRNFDRQEEVKTEKRQKDNGESLEKVERLKNAIMQKVKTSDNKLVVKDLMERVMYAQVLWAINKDIDSVEKLLSVE